MSNNAIGLRELRRHVKYLASLMSGRGKVHEEMSDLWACAPFERIVFWRETIPWPPFRQASKNELLFFIGHETGHLNFTGGWDEPLDWSVEKSQAYKFFQNFIEDIRIERLMEIDYPGFGRIRPDTIKVVMENLWDSIPVEDMPLYQQAGGYWYTRDLHTPKFCSKKMTKFCEDLWPEITRIANASSTQEMSKPLIPIFEMLWKEDPNNGGGGEDNLDSSQLKGAGNGFGDKPSEHPAKSPMGSGQRPLSFEEVINGIANEIGAERSKQILRNIQESNKMAKDKAKKDMLIANGPKAGVTRGASQQPDNSWDRARDNLRPQINILSHRLRTVLKTNEMGNWLEGRRKGRMNTHRAMRAVAGNNRIFRQRTLLGARDYSWGIIIDVSGSMHDPTKNGHSKAQGALNATVLLSEAFEKAQMPFFVVPWDTELRERKRILNKLRQHKNQLGADIIHPVGGTYEAPGLIAAQEEFAQVISGHRVLFVISDGETNGKDESRQILEELEGMGVVTIAIGVGIPAPAHHHKKISIDNAEDLVELLPRLVNEFIRKGGG